MPESHPSNERLQEFAKGQLNTDERGAVVRHLLTGCSQCRARAGKVWDSFRRLTSTDGWSSPQIERVLHKLKELGGQLADEREKANDLLREFLSHPPARRATIAGNSRRLRTYAFCDALLGECFDQLFNDPREAVALAESAVALSASLDIDRYGPALVHDMRGKSLAHLANARRVVDDFQGAEGAFGEAEEQLRHGSGDPLETANLSWLKGHLRSMQREFAEAVQLYDMAISLYRRIGDRHLEGRALVDKATALSHAGDVEAAIRLRQEAMMLLDVEREPRIVLAALHNLTGDLSRAGRAEEALARLEPLRRLHERLGDTMNLIRLRWLEGRVFKEVARLDEAEVALLETRQQLLDKGLGYDVALVSLDLAAVYAQQGRTPDMKRLAAEMLPIFQSLGIHREAIAAGLVFQQAAEMEAVTAGLIQELAAYFQRASQEPGLRFRPPR